MNIPASQLAHELRQKGLSADIGDQDFRLKKSFEAAERAGATYIVIVGENEVKANEFAVKNIKTGIQQTVKREVLAEFFSPAIERRNNH
jgi:histidyl-tRNA synthetase